MTKFESVLTLSKILILLSGYTDSSDIVIQFADWIVNLEILI